MKNNEPQSMYGGVVIKDSTVTAQNIAGGNIHYKPEEIEGLFEAVAAAIAASSSKHQAEASTKLSQLRAELSKGNKAIDGLVAKLLEGLVGLVPTAVGSVAAAFGTPVLAATIGPITKYVLEKFHPSEDNTVQSA